MHYNSKSFLKSKNVCSNTTTIGYQAIMSNEISNEMSFVFLPNLMIFKNLIIFNIKMKLISNLLCIIFI